MSFKSQFHFQLQTKFPFNNVLFCVAVESGTNSPPQEANADLLTILREGRLTELALSVPRTEGKLKLQVRRLDDRPDLGLFVSEFHPPCNAQQVLCLHDEIVSIQGVTVVGRSPRYFAALLAKLAPGESVEVNVKRRTASKREGGGDMALKDGQPSIWSQVTADTAAPPGLRTKQKPPVSGADTTATAMSPAPAVVAGQQQGYVYVPPAITKPEDPAPQRPKSGKRNEVTISVIDTTQRARSPASSNRPSSGQLSGRPKFAGEQSPSSASSGRPLSGQATARVAGVRAQTPPRSAGRQRRPDSATKLLGATDYAESSNQRSLRRRAQTADAAADYLGDMNVTRSPTFSARSGSSSPSRRPTSSSSFGGRSESPFRKSMADGLSLLSSLSRPVFRGEALAEGQVVAMALRSIDLSGINVITLAAIKIQTWIRLVLPRRKLIRRMKNRALVQSIINDIVMLSFKRGERTVRRRDEMMFTGAAIKIQRKFRAWRDTYLSKVVVVQRFMRRTRIRKKVLWLVTKIKAGMNIYRFARRCMKRYRLLIKSKRIKLLGKWLRRYVDYVGFQNRREHIDIFNLSLRVNTFKDVTGLIAFGRRRQLETVKREAAVVKIQSIFRSYVARKFIRKRRRFKMLKKKLYNVISLFMAKLHSERSRKEMNAILLIQARLRGMRARAMMYERIVAGIKITQYWFRYRQYKKLKEYCRRIVRPVRIIIDEIRGEPLKILLTGSLKVKVSVWWSPVLHLVGPENCESIISTKRPQFMVKSSTQSVKMKILKRYVNPGRPSVSNLRLNIERGISFLDSQFHSAQSFKKPVSALESLPERAKSPANDHASLPAIGRPQTLVRKSSLRKVTEGLGDPGSPTQRRVSFSGGANASTAETSGNNLTPLQIPAQKTYTAQIKARSPLPPIESSVAGTDASSVLNDQRRSRSIAGNRSPSPQRMTTSPNHKAHNGDENESNSYENESNSSTSDRNTNDRTPSPDRMMASSPSLRKQHSRTRRSTMGEKLAGLFRGTIRGPDFIRKASVYDGRQVVSNENGGEEVLLFCDFAEEEIAIPGCHGNAVIRFDVYDGEYVVIYHHASSFVISFILLLVFILYLVADMARTYLKWLKAAA